MIAFSSLFKLAKSSGNRKTASLFQTACAGIYFETVKRFSPFIPYTNQLFTFRRRFSSIGLDEGRTSRKNKQNGTVLPEMGLGSKYQQNENNDF